jgi:hypothetical protein
MPVHPKFFICSTCFNRVGIDNIKTMYMKRDECGTLKKVQFKRELSICTSLNALIFLKIKWLLYLKYIMAPVCLCLWAIVPRQQETMPPVPLSLCLPWTVWPSFFAIFVSIFIFCLSGRDLLVSYSMYCTVWAENLLSEISVHLHWICWTVSSFSVVLIF